VRCSVSESLCWVGLTVLTTVTTQSLVPEGFDLMDVDEEALRTGVVRAVDPTTGKTITVTLSAATVAAIALASPSPAVRAQARAAQPPPPTGLNLPMRRAGRTLSKLSGLSKVTSADWAPRESGETDDSGELDANRPSTSQIESDPRYEQYVTTQRVWKDGPSTKMGKMQKRKGDRRRLDAMNDYEQHGFSRSDLANKVGGGGFSSKGRFDDKVVDDPGNTDGGFAYKPVILGDWVRVHSRPPRMERRARLSRASVICWMVHLHRAVSDTAS
jgi:hypothetical protein